MKLIFFSLLAIGYGTLCIDAAEPITFLSLIKGAQVFGPGNLKITNIESHQMIEGFAMETFTSNKASVSSTVSVSAAVGAYSAEASITAGFEKFTSSQTNTNTEKTTAMERRIETDQTIPKGYIGLSIAEMSMYVYKTADQSFNEDPHYVTIPTGNIFTGPFNEDFLSQHKLDRTFFTVAQQYGLKTYKWSDISKMINNPPVVSENAFPLQGVYYAIFSSAYPGTRIGVWTKGDLDIGCGKWTQPNGRPHEDQYWKFEKQDDGRYVLYNKKYPSRRMAAQYPRNNRIMTYGGYLYDDQNFNVKLLGNNKVKIINNAQGTLMMTGDDRCGFYGWTKMPGSDEWKLEAY